MESLDNRFTSQVDFKQPVKSNQNALQCGFCDHWTHLRYTTITVKEYHILAKCDDQYFCHLCNDRLPAFSDSFFLNTSIGNNNTVFDETLENTPNTPNSTSGVNKKEEINSVFERPRESRRLHPRNFLAAHLNINSHRYKFDEIKELLSDKIVDIFFVAESKLDATFNDNLFTAEGYKLLRCDRDSKGGGILAYINTDFPIQQYTGHSTGQNIKSLIRPNATNMFMYKTGCGYFRERGVPKVSFRILAQYTKSSQRNTMSISREEKQRGSLIVLEGCDHSGKTTQCKKLVCALNEAGIKTKAMRFPDRTTTIGKMIDSYLGNECDIEDHSVHLLFSANRWEMVPRMKSDLESGTSLIIDRYAYSGVAFTAAKQGFNINWCKQPDVGLPQPDRVIYLTVSPEEAAKRGTFGDERYEQKEFQQKVSENFEKLRDSIWTEVKADKTIDDLHRELLQIAKNIIEESSSKPLGKLWCNSHKKTT